MKLFVLCFLASTMIIRDSWAAAAPAPHDGSGPRTAIFGVEALAARPLQFRQAVSDRTAKIPNDLRYQFSSAFTKESGARRLVEWARNPVLEKHIVNMARFRLSHYEQIPRPSQGLLRANILALLKAGIGTEELAEPVARFASTAKTRHEKGWSATALSMVRSQIPGHFVMTDLFNQLASRKKETRRVAVELYVSWAASVNEQDLQKFSERLIARLLDSDLCTVKDAWQAVRLLLARGKLIHLRPLLLFLSRLAQLKANDSDAMGAPLIQQLLLQGELPEAAWQAVFMMMFYPRKAYGLMKDIIRAAPKGSQGAVRAAVEQLIAQLGGLEYAEAANAGLLQRWMQDLDGLVPRASLESKAPQPVSPKDLGYPRRVSFSDVYEAAQILRGLPKWIGEISLAGRAVLRHAALTEKPTERRRTVERLATHLWVFEAIDRWLGLPTVGAEFHLPIPENAETLLGLQFVFANFASNVGSHSLVATDRTNVPSVDGRVLPGYPTTLRRLLQVILESEPLRTMDIIGAHVTVGFDFGKALSPVALSAFFGDLLYPWHPIAKGKAELGFPGHYTYRGASLSIYTGTIQGGWIQSNLHVRPARVLQQVAVLEGVPVLEPLDLILEDVERFSWLALALRQQTSDPQPFFLTHWNQWLGDFSLDRGPETQTLVEGLIDESETTGEGSLKGIQGVVETLFEKLYGVSVTEAAQRPGGQLSPSELERAKPYRERLSRLLEDTIRTAIERSAPGIGAEILAYRQATGLAEMDAKLRELTDALDVALSSFADSDPRHKRLRTLLAV